MKTVLIFTIIASSVFYQSGLKAGVPEKIRKDLYLKAKRALNVEKSRIERRLEYLRYAVKRKETTQKRLENERTFFLGKLELFEDTQLDKRQEYLQTIETLFESEIDYENFYKWIRSLEKIIIEDGDQKDREVLINELRQVIVSAHPSNQLNEVGLAFVRDFELKVSSSDYLYMFLEVAYELKEMISHSSIDLKIVKNEIKVFLTEIETEASKLRDVENQIEENEKEYTKRIK